MNPSLRLIAYAIKRVIGSATIGLIALYFLLVVLPAYAGGLHTIPFGESATFVPFYATSGSVRESFVTLLPILVCLFAWYVLPFGLLILGWSLWVLRHALTRGEMARWSIVIFGSVLIAWGTYPAAQQLITYLVD